MVGHWFAEEMTQVRISNNSLKMETKNPPQISKHLGQIKEDKTIRICRQWQVGVRGGCGKNFQLMAIAGKAALNV